MKRKNLYALPALFVTVVIFCTAALCNQCSLVPTDVTEKVGAESSESTAAGASEDQNQSKTSSGQGETTTEIVAATTTAALTTAAETTAKETAENTEPDSETAETVKIAPTIELEIYEGPTYSPADNVCYYRIIADVTGEPAPDVTFSKDDSNGAWGKHKVQVNLHQDETYTLTAIAANSEGYDKDFTKLSWGCDLQKPETTEVTTDSSENEGTTTAKKEYSEQELEYFFESAFGSEYGSGPPELHKWTSNIRIKVNGTPTGADLDTVNQLIAELNTLVSGVSLNTVSDNPNVEIYFTAVSQFSTIEPNYVPGNMGFVWVWWGSSGTIFKGRILIASDDVSQQERSHLIREELTQNLGLLNDSWRYQESIFYQGWTDTTAYAPIDCSIISLLYDQGLRPGMTQDRVKDVLGIN